MQQYKFRPGYTQSSHIADVLTLGRLYAPRSWLWLLCYRGFRGSPGLTGSDHRPNQCSALGLTSMTQHGGHALGTWLRARPERCICWAAGVCPAGSRLDNMQEAISRASP